MDYARSILRGRGLSNDFWAEVINTAVCLKNRSPTKCLNFKAPFEAFYGHKLAVNHLRVFGSKSFAHIPEEDMKKLDPKAMKCIFVGYCTQFKAYNLFNPLTHRFFTRQDVLFNEQAEEGNKEKNIEEWKIPLLMEERNADNNRQQQQQQKEDAGDVICKSSSRRSEAERFEVSPLPRRSGRQTKLPARLKDYALM